MWNAIKSDLFDFVATIQEDTTKTINKVLGEDEEEQDADRILREKIIADIRRSFETYDLPVKDGSKREFDRYMKKFDLGSHAKDIAATLDAEPEVSRFYAELVPLKLTPEVFWARLFFRIKVANRDSLGTLEVDDDEEELLWESEDAKEEASKLTAESDSSNEPSTNDPSLIPQIQKRNKELEEENSKLQSQMRSLIARIAQLEELNSHLQREVTAEKATNSSPLKVNSSSESSETLSTSSEGSAVVVRSVPKEPSEKKNDSQSIHLKNQLHASDPSSTSFTPAKKVEDLPPPAPPLASLDEEEDDGWN